MGVLGSSQSAVSIQALCKVYSFYTLGRIMTIFRDFRALVDAVQNLVAVLREHIEIHREAGPALKRLDSLELSRFQFEAEVQGILLKADGKLKAASNAEARERQLKKSYERDLDPFDPDGQEGSKEDSVLPVDAPAGEAEGVRPVRMGVAPNSKARAVKAKWGT